MATTHNPLSQFSTQVVLPPGTLSYIGKENSHPVELSVFRYDDQVCESFHPEKVQDLLALRQPNKVLWIDLDGIHDLELIHEIGLSFDLHPLMLEDAVNTLQRPKMEEYENGVYVVLKMLSISQDGKGVDTEQVSIFLGNEMVLTFQEKTGDVFEPIRDRLVQHKGRVRKQGADYLFYTLIDVIVSNYFVVYEAIQDQIDEVEERVEILDKEIIQEIQRLKKELIFLRKAIFPLRNVISYIERLQDHHFIHKKTTLFLRDLQDQLTQIIELIETQREILSGLFDLQLGMSGYRLNQVIKVLTVMSTIFIPLTFLVGIYGMNFQYMPELEWKYGYVAVWGIMIGLVIGLLLFFKKKSWL